MLISVFFFRLSINIFCDSGVPIYNMRISLAIVVSVMLVPATLAGPFVPVQHQQQDAASLSQQGAFAGVVSYIRNAMKMSSLQRRDIEKGKL